MQRSAGATGQSTATGGIDETLDVVLTNAGSHSDAVAIKLLELSAAPNGLPSLVCADLISAINELVGPGVRAGHPLAEVTRQQRDRLTRLFQNQLPRALQFAAPSANASGLKMIFQGLGAFVQLSPSDPEHAAPWQTEVDSFDLQLTRDGGSLETLAEVRRLTGAGYARAKELLASLPQVIKVGLSETEAENLGRIFDRLGAEVELVRRSNSSAHSAKPISVPTVPKLDAKSMSQSVEEVSAEQDPFMRLQQLRTFHSARLRPTWQAYIDRLESFASNVKLSKEAAEAAIRAETNQAITAADQRFSDKVAEHNKRLEKIKSEADAVVTETTQSAKQIWDALGKGLQLPEPEGELNRCRADVARDTADIDERVLHSAQHDYEIARRAAAAFPVMQPFASDDTVKNFSIGAGSGSGILFIILILGASTGFDVAALMAGLLFAGIMLIPVYTRSKAAESYNALLDAAARLQVLKHADAEQKKSGEIQRIEIERKTLDVEKEDITSRSAEKLRTVNDKHTAYFKSGSGAFVQARESCRDLLGKADVEIERAVQARFSSYAYLDSKAVSVPSDQILFADRIRFRFGKDLSIPLPELNSATIALLGLRQEELGKPLSSKATPPVFWNFSLKQSLFVSDDQPASVLAERLIGVLISRILHQIPPGKVNFTLFDPIGLGRTFSQFVKLGDFSDQLINGRVWSDRDHIRRKLKDLIEHIETVTQKYLRNDFPDIETYNERAGEIAEPYRVLVAADFPESFDEETARDLVRIVQNGPRCGVFAIIHANLRQKVPHGVDIAVLQPFCLEFTRQEGSMRLGVTTARDGSTPNLKPLESIAVELDEPPNEEITNEVVARFGGGAQKALRVEVPYQRLLGMIGVTADSWWQGTSANGIEVPLGPTGAKKVQTIRLGSGLAHHSLIVGRPGSGKSNLIHVFITTIARLYSPEEVQFYLIDFKKGVEFKCYAEAKLPHARVIAIESEREFGLSVLEGLDAELKARGEQFRSSGSANIAEFRTRAGVKLPRIILVVDEFQEFFTRDDRVKREATILFDRLVRQGRAFGIHLVLGTQSLANAGLERSTQDQMAVRIALQCSEADSRLILGEDNTAARLLTRPGEAIYNDAAGLIEGNNLFQVALFSEDDRTRELAAILEVSQAKDWRGDAPIVFEGHEPAHITACRQLSLAASALPPTEPRAVALWLGEPTALRPTIALPLTRQSGRNLIVLTRDEEQGVGVMLASLLSIAAQAASKAARFAIIDLTSADAWWADHPEEFAAAVPHHAEVLGRRDIKTLLPEIDQEILRRTDGGLMKEPGIFLVLLGLQRARELRQSDGIGPSSFSMDLEAEVPANLPQALARILREGPEVGIHTLIWCDTGANLDRALDRASINEIGLRIAGPLSAQESHRLFDDEAASLINKPHRMLKYDDDQVGAFELFRPYGIPTVEFIADFGKSLKSRAA